MRVTAATRKPLALTVLVASLCSIHYQNADALSLPPCLLSHRQATRTNTELGRGDHHKVHTPHDEQLDLLSSRSPAFSSALFTSPNYRRDRNSRQRRITQHRRSFIRREGSFQLNYKDVDDDDDYVYMMNIIESQQPLKRSIFGWRKRKSLSKALFPPLEVDSSVDDDDEYLMPYDLLEDIQETMNAANTDEEILEPPRIVPKPTIGLGKMPLRMKKKKDQVVVSNINELHEAILDKGLELREVDLKYSPPPSLLKSNWQEKPAEMVTESELSNSDEVRRDLMTNSNHYPEYSFDSMPEIQLEENTEPNADEWQLIGNVLAEDNPVSIEQDTAQEEVNQMFSHDVLNLLHKRYHSQSTPMSRASDDTAILALSIEGGGMRGAVSGGMAAAIACLGLSNAFDSIYGSSAGSIIGSYFVSRQLYLDVYTDVIPAGKDLFVSKGKIIGDIFRNMFLVMRGPLGKRLTPNLIERFRNPTAGANATQASVETLPPTRAGGLNISFVLDSIMCPDSGLRPLDMETFAHNDAVQPLRIVSSAVEMESGKLKSVCFGSKEGNFRDSFANTAVDQSTLGPPTDKDNLYPELESSAQADENGYRRGMWACLGASMTVPGAAGSPFQMNLPSSSDMKETIPHLCFDAFCYEPVPFRMAVHEGATHVLALRSRPAGYEPKTKPTLYERAVAPLYFRSHGVNTVAEFFEKGGQQYLYAEDVLICDHGLNSTEPIPIPPAKVLYGTVEERSAEEKDRKNWAHAHLLPITVPADIPELAVLSQDRDDILTGIRSGFAAAYDALAPVVGLEAGPDSLGGMRVAELVFPEADAPHESVLLKQFPLPGEKLGKALIAATELDIISASAQNRESADTASTSAPSRGARFRRLLSVRRVFRSRRNVSDSAEPEVATPPLPDTSVSSSPAQYADTLMSFLPGVQLGNLPMVAERLQTYLESHSYVEG